MTRPLAIITENLDPECRDWLAQRCDVIECASDDAAFFDHLARAHALIVRTYTQVNDDLLSRAPSLKVVARAGVGTDNIDKSACAKRNITVLNTPDANTRAVVELLFAFILDAFRPRLFLEESLSAPEWKSLRADLIAPRQLAGTTLSILGLGRVGKSVARIASAFNMTVLYHDLIDIPSDQRFGAQPVTLDELLSRADIFTIHVDDRPSNRRIISAPQFAKLKPDCLFINTSRGFVIDTSALADWLRAHAAPEDSDSPGAQAILDVHDPEPFGPDYPLLNLPNAFLSPHIGAATAHAHKNMSWVVKDVWEVLSRMSSA